MSRLIKSRGSETSDLRDGLVLVNEVPTQVMTYGGWIDEPPTTTNKKIIILVLTGNPGIIEYYQQFMETIYRKLDGQFPVWGVSHAGHVKVPENYRTPKLSGNKNMYSVQGQIEHKLAFIEKYVPKDASLILIGHSIGCYIALQLMQCLREQRILKSILLFPTIERLADSPQGKWAWPLFGFLRPILLILVCFLLCLTNTIRNKLLKWYFSSYNNVAPCAFPATANNLYTNCINKWLYMANSEMQVLRELDTDLIRPNLKRLIFYYGAADGWCPVQYYENMRVLFPDGDIHLCNQNFDHAFVLESGVEVGELVSQWIANEVQK